MLVPWRLIHILPLSLSPNSKLIGFPKLFMCLVHGPFGLLACSAMTQLCSAACATRRAAHFSTPTCLLPTYIEVSAPRSCSLELLIASEEYHHTPNIKMPSIEEGRDALLQAGQRVSRGSKSTLKSFTDWAFQDNIIEIASGLM